MFRPDTADVPILTLLFEAPVAMSTARAPVDVPIEIAPEPSAPIDIDPVAAGVEMLMPPVPPARVNADEFDVPPIVIALEPAVPTLIAPDDTPVPILRTPVAVPV
jgi:hypothetical protein